MIIPWADLLYQDRMRIDACAKLLGLEFEGPVKVVREALDAYIRAEGERVRDERQGELGSMLIDALRR